MRATGVTGALVKGAAVTGAALLLGGCANLFDDATRPDPVVKIMATIEHCGLSEPGIHPARPDQEGFSPELRHAVTDLALLPERDAIVVALGSQPTPGYSLGLLNARWYGYATLNLSMIAEKPSEEMVSAQVVTTPCVLIDVPAEGWSQVRVEADLEGFPVAWVRPED